MTVALSIKQLSKTYNNGFQALKGIDFEVKEGDFFALLGPNGAGKSTTIGIICSLVNKTGGQVEVFGYDIDSDFPMAKKQLGVVPQEFNFNNFEKPLDILIHQAGYYGIPRKLAEERSEFYLKKLGLWDKRDTPSRNLSGGMKRRLMIARALIHEPKLLILDEPTAGVDIEMRRSMWAFLQEINAQGTTIILTTHYLEEAESLCKNIAIINHGVIAENTSMRTLLQKLHQMVFVIDVKTSLEHAPVLSGFDCVLVDKQTIEVVVQQSQSLNELFALLSEQQIEVASLRNKTNRLEELFVDLVAKPSA
ncbi:ABC transporter ATP-binding protein [Dasania sp. GY-MA-18]|uniref:ABC transporter ATP-binding protein n=1 Tax=Dasania phycosphaerae TaxID=2950436 RepID=A0A9J6RS03_9GAMM|nr:MULTISPECIES: ABC transporter ATP-binding protein [Dasania]MCR8924298.1 ABC transporter ATP-binding protein [Dasania sp. GY-MA-18]MCZ0866951.1 ABC transporter ATP-binding protein [Dasania phycosphaerae]MCZ0870455.1 ABC transporter ATP-binding protein [Dasania phycosphaerae]